MYQNNYELYLDAANLSILVKHYNSSGSEDIKKLYFSYLLRHIFALVIFGQSEIVSF